jgi:hypothetical protein
MTCHSKQTKAEEQVFLRFPVSSTRPQINMGWFQVYVSSKLFIDECYYSRGQRDQRLHQIHNALKGKKYYIDIQHRYEKVRTK